MPNDKKDDNNNSWGWLGDLAWDVAKWVAWEAFVWGSTYLAAKMISKWARSSNPSLTEEHAQNIEKLLGKAVVDYRFRGGAELEATIMSILMLICPDGADVSAVFRDMVNNTDREASEYGLSEEELAKRRMPSDVEFTTTKVEDDASDVLIEKYGLNHDRVLLIPLELRQALLTTLETNPTCPISLEPVVDPVTGHVNTESGFTVLFQYLNDKPHAFIFESEAIHGWVQHHNTNPVTRQSATRKEFFVLTIEGEEPTPTTTTTTTTTGTAAPTTTTTTTTPTTPVTPLTPTTPPSTYETPDTPTAPYSTEYYTPTSTPPNTNNTHQHYSNNNHDHDYDDKPSAPGYH